jgi:sulfhydrogenase subunit delta
MTKPTKLRVGIYGITGCMGCQLNILYQKELLDILEVVDLVAFPVGKEKNIHDNLDIVFLEGVVVNEKDLEELKEIREKTKILVAIGSCATDGCVPAIKNFVNNKNIELSVYQEKELEAMQSLDPMPIDEFVKVDHYIYGCPMDKAEFLKFMKQILLGKTFKQYEKPICYECNLRERGCLLEEGIECLGPVTFGSCSVMCPEENYPCIGCRGPYGDANYEAYFKLLESKGIPHDAVFSHLNRFAGVKFKRAIDKECEEKGIENLITKCSGCPSEKKCSGKSREI